MSDHSKQPTYVEYRDSGFISIYCNGYHPKYNPKKDYDVAKRPSFEGWNDPEYESLSDKEIADWEKAGGWIGWIIPRGCIALDVEDQEAITLIKAICRDRGIEPGIHITDNGVHFLFRTDKKLSAASKLFIKCGVEITYRVGGKNYLLLAPINGRTWECWYIENLPSLPDGFLPYDRKNKNDVLNCLSWAVREAYQAGYFSGYEDIDAAFMSLLIGSKLAGEQIKRAFQIVFQEKYDEKQTSLMLSRTQARMENGDPLLGAGTFMQKAKDAGLKEVRRFVRELQVAADTGRVTVKEMIQEASPESVRDILKRLAALHETERAVYVNALAKKLGISKRSIQKDIENLSRKMHETPDIDRLLESGANPQSNFSAQTFNNGVLSYGAILGSERILVRSDGEIVLANGSKGDSFRFKRSALTTDAIKRFRAGEDVDGKGLLDRIQILLTDHVVFKDSRIALLFAVWVIGTYLFKAFRFFGYLWINSPVKRCGKSLLLDILSLIAFNATPRLVNPSEASVFREVDSNDATLIIDEVESLSHREKDQKSEMISLINSGFQRGSLASRVETRNKEFVVTYYNSYCPKVLAGIKGIVDTIEDRSFKIPMVRKTKDESIKRFNFRTLDAEIERIKEDCFIWALRYAADVSDFYDSMPDIEGTGGLDDRMKDILEPLLSIASIIDALADDKNVATEKALVRLASDMAGGRENQEALSGFIPAIVNVMTGYMDGKDERFISCDEMFSKFQSDDDLGFIASKKGMAFFLSKLDLHRTPPRWIEGKTTRGYVVTRKWVEDLEKRYA